MIIPTVLIRKVQNKSSLTKEEIFSLVNGFKEGIIPEYQMSAFLMAVFFQGVSQTEKEHLTLALLESGKQMEWPLHSRFVDKHSTGGVGDKTSIIIAPLLTAMGYKVPMMSGRGLGHTGGTLDKLESLPHVSTDFSLDVFEKRTLDYGLCFIGQTDELTPADKKIYALRDVTSTVSSLPLITASIVSKKIAEGVKGLVYDVKTGTGAFIKSHGESMELAKSLVETSESLGAKSVAVISDMSQPLGRWVGNKLEMLECFEILQGKERAHELYADTIELSIHLCARLISLYEDKTYEEIYGSVKSTLKTDKPLEILSTILKEQGWQGMLPKADTAHEDFFVEETGFISSMNTEQIGWAGVALGVGRKSLQDQIDPHVGFYFHKKLGDQVDPKEPVLKIYYNDKKKLENCKELLKSAFEISSEKIEPPQLIQDIVYGKTKRS